MHPCLLDSCISPICILNAGKLAPQGVQLFWQELRRAAILDGFLQLPNGVSFLGDADIGSQMLQRSCYGTLIERIQQLRIDKLHRFLITGESGCLWA